MRALLSEEVTLRLGCFVLYQGTVYTLAAKLPGKRVRLFRNIGRQTKRVTVPMADVAEFKLPGGTIRNVEIFRVGIWNGDKFTLKDLQDMVDAFGQVGYRPAVKLGHDEVSGGPAYGWVDALRIRDDTLLADFVNVPDEVIQMIRDKRFDFVSAEIFFDLSRNGKKFRRALKAVALLGAEVPGVADLQPLSEADFTGDSYSLVSNFKVEPMDKVAKLKAKIAQAAKDGDQDAVSKYTDELTQLLQKEGTGDTEVKDLRQEVERLRERDRQRDAKDFASGIKLPALRPHFETLFMHLTSKPAKVSFTANPKEDAKETDAAEVLKALSEKINSLVKDHLFTDISDADNADDPAPANRKVANSAQAAEEVDRRANALREKDDKLSYGDAVTQVLNKDPQLKKLYAAA